MALRLMHRMENKQFPDLGPDELERYARGRAADLGLPVPEAYLAGVLENLSALQTHATILRTCFEGAGPPTPGPPAP